MITNMNGQPVDADPAVIAAVQIILNELNGGNCNKVAQGIFDAVSHEHRTLQQAFWSAVLKAQIAYASCSHDLRNEQAVELAGAVKALAQARNWDFGLRYL